MKWAFFFPKVAKLCLSKQKERKKHLPPEAGNGLKYLDVPLIGIYNPISGCQALLEQTKGKKKAFAAVSGKWGF
ncbi:MAG: hypothetical protein ACK5EK_02410 [Flavobacteriia bacterium]